MKFKEYAALIEAWNTGRAEWSDLEFLFALNDGYPQYSGPEVEQAILALGQRKWVPAQLIRLRSPRKASRRELDTLLQRHRYYDADNYQGPQKLLALQWLKTRGAKELAAEGDYVAGRYDVASEDLRIVVECGTTRLEKFLKTALSNDWREFVLIPRRIQAAILFDFTRKPFDLVRAVGKNAWRRTQYLLRACEEPRITKRSLERCRDKIDDAYREKCRQAIDLLGRRASPIFFFS